MWLESVSLSASEAMATTPRLELIGITKQYPAVRANDGVNLSVAPGSIHAVLGENGAGKSTLMKIAGGALRPDAGRIVWNGQPVSLRSPAEARQLGISMVYQHFSLFETLTAAENVWLGLDRSVSLPQVIKRIERVAQQHGLAVDPLRPVHTLSVGERQRVEIVRALLGQPQLLILDEPTSVLTPQAVEQLFITLRGLAAQGCSIVYISHKLHEIRALCDRCTVLRGGRVVADLDPRHESDASLSRLMIGAEPMALAARRDVPGAVVLQLRALSLPKTSPYGTDLTAIDLEVRAGEIVGIAGVSGNGQPELVAALSGEDPRAAPGSITLFGTDIARAEPPARRALGLHFVPEERLGRGAVPAFSLAHNTLLTRTEGIGPFGWLRIGRMNALATSLIKRFQVKAGGPMAAANSLSGGNLQKFIVGREIDAQPKMLILSQPTWGVDVGAAAQVRAELMALRDAGCALLVVSDDLDELFALADRLVVMAEGRLSPSVPIAQATAAQIGSWMSGLWPRAVATANEAADAAA